MSSSRPARLLIHPPFADPTQPYVSLPTLQGWLRAKGQEVELLDLNVEAAHWLLSPENLASLAASVDELCVSLNRKRALSFEQQRQYRAAWSARPRIALAAAAAAKGQTPLDVFRSRERFFDLEQYERARMHAEAAFEAVNALHFPYRYSWNGASHSVVPWSFALLERHASEPGPLDEMYRRLFETGERGERLRDAEFVGFSLAFPSQIPEAIRLARRWRTLAPKAFFAFGGPSIHQVAVHLEDELRLALLDVVDGIGLFEGERLLEELLPRLPEWGRTRDNTLLLDVPNLLLRDPSTGKPRVGPKWTLDLRESPAPDPTGLDLDRYLAPSRTLLYAPTRGCYWNECSFCYYGLSETATASYREIPPERAAADMEALSRAHGVRNFYISCDVLSPVYAVKLATAIAARGLDVSWSSDLKIEKYFNEERARVLRAGGLRSAAFGIESGSDRILALMRKGCDRATMTRVNREFHAAGIATQWMTFTDHPGETLDEALATVSWVEEEKESVSLFIVGEFGLERGSAIFQDPGAFGLSRVSFAEGDELRLYALYEEEGGGRSPEDKSRVEAAVRRASAGWRLNPYPWAGANSTHHSFLHFLERGVDAFRHDAERQREIARDVAREASKMREPERPRFSLAEIAERERRFFERYLSRALYTTLPENLGGPGFSLVALSIDDYEREAARQRELSAG